MALLAEPLVWLGPPGRSAVVLSGHAVVDAVPAAGRFSVGARAGYCAEALRLAAELPERVLALVLESPTCAPDPSVSLPTLVVVGNDAASQNGSAFRARMPNCHYVLVYAAGAEIADDRPEAFAALVSDFLDRREGFIVSQRSGLLHP